MQKKANIEKNCGNTYGCKWRTRLLHSTVLKVKTAEGLAIHPEEIFDNPRLSPWMSLGWAECFQRPRVLVGQQ
jgi:hypothetical protein